MSLTNHHLIRKRISFKANEKYKIASTDNHQDQNHLVHYPKLDESNESSSKFKFIFTTFYRLPFFAAEKNVFKKMDFLTEDIPLIELDVSQEDIDRTSFEKISETKEVQEENIFQLVLQIFIPFLIAGFGTVGAGMILNFIQHWNVFQNISELIILIPALLGLKGNLEMTLASRLSTQAHLGLLNSSFEKWKITLSNIALIQCQAAVVGFLAALFAITMNWLSEAKFNLNHALLSCASSLLTACSASFILGLVMICVVIISYECKINPDNVATPIAASLGDLTTIFILARISNMFYFSINRSIWLCSIVIIVILILIPFWCIVASRNSSTRDVLYTGWLPVINAMAISSFGGCILDFAISRFKEIGLFQPIINGVGGNLVSVQASRMSTYLHRTSKLGMLPFNEKLPYFTLSSVFLSTNTHSKTARCLLLMTIPGHLIFTFCVRIIQGHGTYTPVFLIVYLSAAFLQVFFLLYCSHIMVLYMWNKGIDPDNSAIPYLTAIGDLLGTALLTIAFLFLSFISNSDLEFIKKMF